MVQIARRPLRPVVSLILIALVLLGALTACGGSMATATGTRGGSAAPSAAASAAASSAASAAPAASGAPGRSAQPSASGAPTAIASSAPSSGAPSGSAVPRASGPGASAAPSQTPPLYIPVVSRQLIKTGTVSMVVQDVDLSFEDALKIAQDNGGDLLQYTNSKSGDRRVADLILQVDSAKFEQAMRSLRAMKGIVERKMDKADVQEITNEVVDVQAQIKNLEITEQQLRTLLERTDRTDEVLSIQREINNVRVQIDRLKTQANQLAEQTQLSTITLHLESGPPAVVAPPASAAWDPATSAGRAWNASLSILQGIGTVAITFLVFTWWMLPLIPLAWWAYRRYRRAHPAASARPARIARRGTVKEVV